MSVYERVYRGYAGPLTPERSRFLVIPRYAFQRLFDSKATLAFLTLGLLFPLGCAFYVYGRSNLAILETFGITAKDISPIAIGPGAASFFLQFQGLLVALIMTVTFGPGLISPDLRNNALPLYFSRPIGRWEYLVGKALVLFSLLSVMTWIPGLLLFTLQGVFAGFGWVGDNAWLAAGTTLGFLLLIVVNTLLALTVSAVVKWKPVAGAVIFIVFVFGRLMALAVNASLNTTLGNILDLQSMIHRIWIALLGVSLFDNQKNITDMPLALAIFGLLLFVVVCLVILQRKIRAYEVVR